MNTLDLQADLVLSAGDVEARIVADGGRLTLVTDNITGLWDEARHADLPTDSPSMSKLLGRFAGGLDTAGITFAVTGDTGTLFEIGRDCDSVLGHLLTGDRHVRLGHPRVVLPIAARAARATISRHRRAWLGGPVAIVLAYAAARAAERRAR